MYNAHRIHYDHQYSTRVEGYRDVVVQGPFLAATMLEMLYNNASVDECAISRVSWRASSPCFVNSPISVCGRRSGEENVWDLWAVPNENKQKLLMTGRVYVRD